MTATEAVRAVETCAITETEALQRTGAQTMVALYRLAILELAPQMRGSSDRQAANRSTQARAA